MIAAKYGDYNQEEVILSVKNVFLHPPYMYYDLFLLVPILNCQFISPQVNLFSQFLLYLCFVQLGTNLIRFTINAIIYPNLSLKVTKIEDLFSCKGSIFYIFKFDYVHMIL